MSAEVSLETLEIKYKTSSTLEEKIDVVFELRRINNNEANELLLTILDDPSVGGSLRDENILVHAPWLYSLVFLTERFPEAQVNARELYFRSHQEGMKEINKFKTWWKQNKARIRYHDNTPSFEEVISVGTPNGDSAKPLIQPNNTSKPTPVLPNTKTIQHPKSIPSKSPDTIQPAEPKTPQKSESTETIPVKESRSTNPWSIIAGALVAAAGLLWLFLRKSKS